MEKIDKKESGRRLRHEREGLGLTQERLRLTQEELAEQLGTTAVNVSRWESGQISPGEFYRKKLCALFGKSEEYLFPLEREQDAFRPVFYCNTPLPNVSELHGRDLEKKMLHTRLGQCASTSLIGPPRIGKTWLLHSLQAFSPGQLNPKYTYHIGYLDATWPSCKTVAGLTASMVEVLEIAPENEGASPPDHLLTLQRALRGSQGQAYVLCIDEFEHICEKQDCDKTFFEGLRGLAQINGDRMMGSRLCFVTASRHPLGKLLAEKLGNTSPFFNIFLQVELGSFRYSTAETFAEKKSQEAGFTKEEREALLKFGQETQGNLLWPPLRLQLVGLILQKDAYFARVDPDYPYNPRDPLYWQMFGKRVEDEYRTFREPQEPKEP